MSRTSDQERPAFARLFRSGGSVRGALVHCGRVGLLALILLMMAWQQQRMLQNQRAAGLDAVSLSDVQALFPTATALGEADAQGGRVVRAGDQLLGSVLQTFPEAEKFLGFSGPTNLLLGFDVAGKIVGLAILSSGDTREHVGQIRQDPKFLQALNGRTAEEAAATHVDAVTGATLTSLAILQGIQSRLGHQGGSLKFPEEYTVGDAQRIFPEAARLQRVPYTPELWLVEDVQGEALGYLLSNSPAADNFVGYQGPTRAFLGTTLAGEIRGLIVKESFENSPYIDSVRDDKYFSRLFRGLTIEELAKKPLNPGEVEGVSGATMSSQTIAEGLLLAARTVTDRQARQIQEQSRHRVMRWRVATTLTFLALGLLLGLTRWRQFTVLRRIYQVALIGVMGFINGDLLSMAMFVGWARNGIPWTNALGLVCLAAAAVALPIVSGVNIYCDHICPHGAAQQLLPRRWKLQHRPRWLITILHGLRPLLLAIVVATPLLGWSISLVDIEPFDAYLVRTAGVATTAVALTGLLLSLFLPMGYCQYGCPTGAVLGYLRRHSRSGELTTGDGVAAGLLVLALYCCFWNFPG
ncbi:FMN-binding protein [Planctomicrobium sp. SH664]|uniref:FMN-binding protein n=1 Tax=Planctomicrobium sp. SH664 TaxID=3448125 RepID=UPI003F5C8C1F